MVTEPMGSVLVGVDGSPSSLSAVDLAAEEAAGRVTPLVITHVEPAPIEGFEPAPPALEILETAAARAAADHPSLSIERVLAYGSAAHELIGSAATCGMLVIGHRGRRGWKSLLAGSVAVEVSGAAPAPVLVHRPILVTDHSLGDRPVMVAVADNGIGDDVLEFAFTEASLRGARLQAMNVWAEVAGAHPTSIRGQTHDFGDASQEAQRMLAEALAGWSTKFPDVRVDHVVRHSLDVANTLIAASQRAQLVVVGPRTHSGLGRLAHGSTSRALVHRAGCPVAVVNPRA